MYKYIYIFHHLLSSYCVGRLIPYHHTLVPYSKNIFATNGHTFCRHLLFGNKPIERLFSEFGHHFVTSFTLGNQQITKRSDKNRRKANPKVRRIKTKEFPILLM